MKIAVTGHKGGMVRDALVAKGVTPIASDITDKVGIQEELSLMAPEVVIHAAAMTGVDRCQNDYKKAFLVNVRGTAKVAEACKSVGAKFIYLSSCHIFDGKKKPTKSYSEMSRPNPLNAYGFTKWEGEEVIPIFGGGHTIIRISKIFDGKNFKRLLESSHIDQMELPTFIYRNYTYLSDFVDLLLEVANNHRDFPRVMNLGSILPVSMFEFWRLMFETHVLPRNDPDYTMTPRPYNGMLDMSVALEYGLKLPTVAEGVLRMLGEIQDVEKTL